MSNHSLYRQETKPQFEASLLVLYDLRHPGGWKLARRALAAWGEQRTDIYACGVDHVIVGFRPGGAQEVAR
jgi:hypothetical protein